MYSLEDRRRVAREQGQLSIYREPLDRTTIFMSVSEVPVPTAICRGNDGTCLCPRKEDLSFENMNYQYEKQVCLSFVHYCTNMSVHFFRGRNHFQVK